MSMNDQKVAKIRGALDQLDPANDAHWTDDSLPRESAVRDFAGDQSITRKDIQDAHPGFQRHAQKPEANVDPLTGEPMTAAALADGFDDPAKNTGEFMSDEEVRVVLEQRVKDATQAVADAQKAVRDANAGVLAAQEKLRSVREDLTREFPPLTVAQNIKQYIASEQAQRATAHGPAALAPGSQIDAAMQRSNSRGWRRPTRNGPVQTGAARPAA